MSRTFPFSQKAPPVVLIFAASDPVSGAGAQADMLTLAALGCHPATAITALTVQDTIGVHDLAPVAAEQVAAQARAVLADLPVAVFKFGVLGSAKNAHAAADIAEKYPEIPLVLDPVLASGRGDALADEALIDVLRTRLLPRAALITPNTPEARRLSACATEDLAQIAARLLALGARHVLLTGTHAAAKGPVCNHLYDASGLLEKTDWARLPGSFHGSGCTLAAACAAHLAHGKDMLAATRAAQEFTWQSLAHAFAPGKGQRIPDRFWRQKHVAA
ncbi:MAG: hydroxymethylpyrimidine/phosphomethylpyrimidine kinase [Zoogloeaceae bacterium]|jgi:hydroxymethylpyrimidine/phosphomethylpyrimidine kinase|nr:hydroxymethylpyrimidine/phosphomethylpyrimidine kinase [Zoogloeaceae bacterium]